MYHPNDDFDAELGLVSMLSNVDYSKLSEPSLATEPTLAPIATKLAPTISEKLAPSTTTTALTLPVKTVSQPAPTVTVAPSPKLETLVKAAVAPSLAPALSPVVRAAQIASPVPLPKPVAPPPSPTVGPGLSRAALTAVAPAVRKALRAPAAPAREARRVGLAEALRRQALDRGTLHRHRTLSSTHRYRREVLRQLRQLQPAARRTYAERVVRVILGRS